MTSENEKGLKAQGNFSRSKGANGLAHDCGKMVDLGQVGLRANLTELGQSPSLIISSPSLII